MARYNPTEIVNNIQRLMGEEFPEGEGATARAHSDASAREAPQSALRVLSQSVFPQLREHQRVDRIPEGATMALPKKVLMRALRIVSGRQAAHNYFTLTGLEILAQHIEALTQHLQAAETRNSRSIDQMAVQLSGLETSVGMITDHVGELTGTPLRRRRLEDLEKHMQLLSASLDEFQRGQGEVVAGLRAWVGGVEHSLQDLWKGLAERDARLEKYPLGIEGLRAEFAAEPATADDTARILELQRRVAHLAERVENVGIQSRDHVGSAWKSLESLSSRTETVTGAVQQMETRLAALETQNRELMARLVVLSEQNTLQMAELEALRRAPPAAASSTSVAAPATRRPLTPPPSTPAPVAPPETSELDRHQTALAYLRFQRQFRGDEKQLRDRQRTYIELLRSNWTAARPVPRVLDIACGDGVFLEILREAGWEPHGVDLNVAMVRYGQGRNLPIELGDAVEYLEAGPANHWDAVTAFQFVEHLDPAVISRLLRAAYRALVPGGLLIIETLNPNTLMSLKWFHLDLTHDRLIFPQMLQLLMESAAFRFIEWKGINPVEDHEKLILVGDVRTQANWDRLNEFLFGAQDYYAIARKPEPT